jgi:WD40 repeat protein
MGKAARRVSFIQGARSYERRSIAASPDGRLLLCASRFGIELYSWRRTNIVERIDANTVFTSAAFDDSGNLLVAASYGTVFAWRLSHDRPKSVAVIPAHHGNVTSIVARADGVDDATIVTGGQDGNIKTWRLSIGREMSRSPVFAHPVSALGVTPDNERILAGANRGEPNLRLLDAGGKVLESYTVSGGVSSVAISPDGTLKAVGTSSGHVEVSSLLVEADVDVVLEGHTSAAIFVTFTADGHFLVSHGEDGSVFVWRTGTWERFTELVRPFEQYPLFASAALNTVESTIAILGPAGQVTVWDFGLETLHGESEVGSVRYVTKRVALVGDTGVGKTTLGWRLVSGEFQPQESTHGQQFWPFDLLSQTKADGTRAEAVLWDFAGQPEYRIVHSLFLEHIDCALILFDASNHEEPLRGVEYWRLYEVSGGRGVP